MKGKEARNSERNHELGNAGTCGQMTRAQPGAAGRHRPGLGCAAALLLTTTGGPACVVSRLRANTLARRAVVVCARLPVERRVDRKAFVLDNAALQGCVQGKGFGRVCG